MTLIVDDSAVKRIQDLRTKRNQSGLMLRVTIDSGGCTGFQYVFSLTEEFNEQNGDIKIGDYVLTDDMSMPFLEGATIRFKQDKLGSEFAVDNPNAVSGCGCGASFTI